MRIDDENKTVWCSEPEMEWYVSFNATAGNSMFLNLRRINALSTEKEVLLPSYMTTSDRFEIIRAISDKYTFKLEQPKKYYWRKKKEHLAWFEENNGEYLSTGLYSEPILDVLLYSKTFTETEARDLLKDDFDKFEKVKCE